MQIFSFVRQKSIILLDRMLFLYFLFIFMSMDSGIYAWCLFHILSGVTASISKQLHHLASVTASLGCYKWHSYFSVSKHRENEANGIVKLYCQHIQQYQGRGLCQT